LQFYNAEQMTVLLLRRAGAGSELHNTITVQWSAEF